MLNSQIINRQDRVESRATNWYSNCGLLACFFWLSKILELWFQSSAKGSHRHGWADCLDRV